MATLEPIPFLNAKPFSNFSLQHIEEKFRSYFEFNPDSGIVTLIQRPPIDEIEDMLSSLYKSEKTHRSFSRVCLFQGDPIIKEENSTATPNSTSTSVQIQQEEFKIIRDWSFQDTFVGCEFIVQGLKCMNCVSKVKRTLSTIKLNQEENVFSFVKLVKEGSLCVFWNQNEMTKQQQIKLVHNIMEEVRNINFLIAPLVLPITMEWSDYKSKENHSTISEVVNIVDISSTPVNFEDEVMENIPLIIGASGSTLPNTISSKSSKIGNIDNIGKNAKNTKLKNNYNKEYEMEEYPETSVLVGIYNIYGMHCASCVSKIEDGLSKLGPSVLKASINLMMQQGRIEFDSNEISSEDISNHISSLGFTSELQSLTSASDLKKKSTTSKLLINGMHCKNCPLKIEKHFSNIPGVKRISPNLETGKCIVEYYSFMIGIRQIIEDIKSLGFQANVCEENEDEIALLDQRMAIRDWTYRFASSLIFCIPVIFLTIYGRYFGEKVMESGISINDILVALLTTPIVFYSGWHYHSNAFKSLKHGYADMNVLISLGTLTAYVSSLLFLILTIFISEFNVSMYYFETAAMTISFQTLGKLLEVIAKGRTSTAITSLMKLQSRKAILVLGVENQNIENIEGKDTDEIDSKLLQCGDIVKVFPGSIVPGDGIVVSGFSMTNESMLTGESRSVPKNKDDHVYGGTINEDGVLFVKITEVGESSFLSQIVNLVKEAQTSKAPIQKIADQISKVFVPFIILISIVVFFVWFFSALSILPQDYIPKGSNAFLFSISFPMAVLVIACPCALGLATPTAVLVSTGIGAQMGVLIKGGEALETSHNINAVVFDKTGTLTIGKPTVSKYQIFDKDSISSELFFSLLLSVERNSEHPVGKSIVEYAIHHTRNTIPIASFSVVPGKGVLATLRKKESILDHVIIGNRQLLEENGVKIPPRRSIKTQESLSRTVVLVALNKRCIGYVSLQDQVHPEAYSVVKKLHEMGIETFILSGDQKESVDSLQKSLGIHYAYSQVLPQDKARIIRELKKEGYSVCMIGDGINDSPALVESNLGMAIGTGTDIAIQSANVVLVRNDLRGILIAFDLARTTYRRIKLNHFWAFGYNIVFVPLACGILYPWYRMTIPPILAACSMMFSSLLVITSSLLLRLYKPPKA